MVRRLWAAVPRSLERTLVALVQEVLRAAGAARGALGRDIEDDAIWLVRADALRNPFVREHLRDETRSLTDSDVRLLLLLLSPTRAEAHAQRALLVCLLALARAQEPSSPLAAGLGAVALRIVASACPGPLGDDYLAVERACVLAQWAFAVSADAQQLSHCCSAVCGSALAPSVADVLLAVLASACSCFPRMQRGVFNDALARYALLCQELCADAKTRLQKAFLVELMGALCRGADAESLDIEGALLSLLSLSVQDQRDPVLALAPLVCAHSTHAAALLVLPLNKHLRGDAAARAYALLALFRLLPSADDLLQVEIGRILLQYCAQTAGVRRSLTSQLLEVMMQDLQEKRLCAGLLSLVLSHVRSPLPSLGCPHLRSWLRAGGGETLQLLRLRTRQVQSSSVSVLLDLRRSDDPRGRPVAAPSARVRRRGPSRLESLPPLPTQARELLCRRYDERHAEHRSLLLLLFCLAVWTYNRMLCTCRRVPSGVVRILLGARVLIHFT